MVDAPWAAILRVLREQCLTRLPVVVDLAVWLRVCGLNREDCGLGPRKKKEGLWLAQLIVLGSGLW